MGIFGTRAMNNRSPALNYKTPLKEIFWFHENNNHLKMQDPSPAMTEASGNYYTKNRTSRFGSRLALGEFEPHSFRDKFN